MSRPSFPHPFIAAACAHALLACSGTDGGAPATTRPDGGGGVLTAKGDGGGGDGLPGGDAATPTGGSDTQVGVPSRIACPTTPRPQDGWPLIFLWNGNCFRSVEDGGLAGDAADALRSASVACTAVLTHADLTEVEDIDASFRSELVPRIDDNRGLIDASRVGGVGFSAGGTVASLLGTRWAQGIDPDDGADHDFRVAAIVNLYGPLRMDRSSATGPPAGGGGLLYLHERRSQGLAVDIPGARQWDSPNCYCAARGQSPCDCQTASSRYLEAYLTADAPNPRDRVCSFRSDDASLTGLSATDFIGQHAPAHIAALYLCSGSRDSNVDHDANLHQALSFWSPAHRVVVALDDGHSFPLSACESRAANAGLPSPGAWLAERFAATGDLAPSLP